MPEHTETPCRYCKSNGPHRVVCQCCRLLECGQCGRKWEAAA